MYNRKQYINLLEGLRQKDIIKILTGVRRCGKSTVMKYFAQNNCVKGNCIFINLEEYENRHLKNPDNLHEYVITNIVEGVDNYLFIDEIQLVENFETVINSIHSKKIIDIYLTGSNAFLLSSDIATLLSGRYVEIHLLPFSYNESKEFIASTLQDYKFNGGLPTLFLSDNVEIRKLLLEGIRDSVINKDIIRYNKNINETKLERILSYYIDNIGNIENSKKVSDYFTSNENVMFSVKEVQVITNAFLKSFLFYECKRYDLKGKKILTHSPKYYLVDHVFKTSQSMSLKDEGRVVENIVFLELKRRYKEVYIGKINEYEIDFIVEKDTNPIYIQVALTIINEETLQREVRPLNMIKDNFEKIIISDDNRKINIGNGIKHYTLEEFLENN